MRKKFSWEPFSADFIQSIVYSRRTPRAWRPKADIKDKLLLLPFIDSIALRPDSHFIRRYRSEITDNFLAGSTHLVTIMRELVRINYRKARMGSMEEMLAVFNRFNLSSTVINLIRNEIMRKGMVYGEQEGTICIKPIDIDLELSIPKELSLFPYQKEAVNKLEEHFITNKAKSGVLVMPTGSGKTRVATRFALQDMVAAGYQVLWLTHRAMLIEQTADAMYTTAPIVRLGNPRKKRMSMVCVSGSHASIKSTRSDQDLMILSVQTLRRNLDYLQAVIRNKVLIIVDEAHHTLAPSYRIIIKKVKELASTVKLLGLTATPVRMQDQDTARLMGLFDNNIIYSISMNELIAKGTLARPVYERVDTNVDFTTKITLDEREYIRKWGELSPETLDYMAGLKERNALIADIYMNRQKEYGKTLIFAVNGHHCISLCEELVKRGVKCDYVYSGHDRNEAKIKAFKEGELDVLVNINILTEGSDVPDIQTVFLTRPTNSDVLLMQMIGRGMRGPECGGTEEVNIVDFHDNWGSMVYWLNPRFLLAGEQTEEMETSKSQHDSSTIVPWESLRDVLDQIETEVIWGQSTSHAILPTGWYDVVDEDGNDGKVLVFDSQIPGFKSLWNDKDQLLKEEQVDGNTLLNRYFSAFGLQPSANDLQLLVDTYRLEGQMLKLHLFKERKLVDAYHLAQELKEKNIGVNEISSYLDARYQQHESILKSIHGDFETFQAKVMDFLLYPKGSKPLGCRIEELPEEALVLDREPCYDLHELTREVVDSMFEDGYGDLPEINWTNKPYQSYFGVYRYPSARGERPHILINQLLNSKDVPRECVKYVIYHELLHRDFMRHDAAFRVQEHRYPNWTEHERFLDVTFPKFDLMQAI